MKDKFLKFLKEKKFVVVIAAIESFLVSMVIFLGVMVLNAGSMVKSVKQEKFKVTFTVVYDSLTLSQAATKENEIKASMMDAKIDVDVEEVEVSDTMHIHWGEIETPGEIYFIPGLFQDSASIEIDPIAPYTIEVDTNLTIDHRYYDIMTDGIIFIDAIVVDSVSVDSIVAVY